MARLSDRAEWLQAWTGLATDVRAAADEHGYHGRPLDLRCDTEEALRHPDVRRAFGDLDILLLLPGRHAAQPVDELRLRIEPRVFDVAARLIDETGDTELGAWALPWTRTRLLARPRQSGEPPVVGPSQLSLLPAGDAQSNQATRRRSDGEARAGAQ
jgi:hypothetical protein